MYYDKKHDSPLRLPFIKESFGDFNTLEKFVISYRNLIFLIF